MQIFIYLFNINHINGSKSKNNKMMNVMKTELEFYVSTYLVDTSNNESIVNRWPEGCYSWGQ